MNITGTLIDFKTGQPAKWHEIQVAAYAWLIGKNWDKNGRLISDNPDFKRVSVVDTEGKITSHKYLHAKAKRIFTVTQVCTLGSWQYSDQAAANEGTWIHQAISLIDQGKFTYTRENAPNIPVDMWKKIDAYKSFIDRHSRLISGLREIPLCAKCGNPGTYIAGAFDKFTPGNWPLEILLLYLKDDGDYKLVPMDAKKIAVHMSFFRKAVSWLEYTK